MCQSNHFEPNSTLTALNVEWMPRYYPPQLRYATSPEVVEQALALKVRPSETLVVFTNEKNRTMFDNLKVRSFHSVWQDSEHVL